MIKQPPGRLLLISQPDSYRIAPFLTAARDLGVPVDIASRGQHSLTLEVNQGLHIDLDNIESAVTSILDAARVRPYAAIIGTDDSTVEIAAYAAQKLDLIHNNPEAARGSRRKDLARQLLKTHTDIVPDACLIKLDSSLSVQFQKLNFPLVLKPLHLSASRGVIRVNTIEEATKQSQRIKSIIKNTSSDDFELNHILAEQFIAGEEVAFEGFLQSGVLHQLTIYDKPDPLDGPYFEETIYITPSRLSQNKQEKIFAAVEKACVVYGLTTGPVHAELRVDDNNAWILEVASRTIGGDCSRTLDINELNTVEKLTIKLAMGMTWQSPETTHSTGVMMIPIPKAGLLTGTLGLVNARKVPGITSVDIVIPTGYELTPLPEGSQYLGYIFARGNSPEDVEDALRTSFSHLKFQIAPLLKIKVS